MMTTLATLLFTAMMATALASLAWDLTRDIVDPDADTAWESARAEAMRIAALPRSRQPSGVIGRVAGPVPGLAPVRAPVRRPSLRPLAAAA